MSQYDTDEFKCNKQVTNAPGYPFVTQNIFIQVIFQQFRIHTPNIIFENRIVYFTFDYIHAWFAVPVITTIFENFRDKDYYCVFPFFQIWFCCMILFTLLLFQSPLYYVRNFLPLVNFFQNFSMPAVTHPITKPSNKTKNIPPTFGSPSSLTDPLPASESPPPALHCSPFSLFHHLFLSLWIIPSSLSLIIALLTYERNGDPVLKTMIKHKLNIWKWNYHQL